MLDLLDQIVSRSDRGETLAVCTLVRTRGSTPQKAGAVLLVLAGGETIGTIGGGCVEAEVRTRALRLFADPSDRLFTFKLDHDLGWDDGLICGGIMDVAVQVISRPDGAAPFRILRDALAAGKSVDVHIAVRDEDDRLVHFRSPLQPAPTLIIAGAGHVGSALTTLASQLDFEVMLIDDRPDLAAQERFPRATIRVGSVDVELGKLTLNQHSHVVIVTRGHRRDALALAAVVRSDAGYVGLIGSRRKIIKIFGELCEQGVSKEQLTRVHAPVGLDIGAITPAEIAVSIAAELIAKRRGRNGLPALSMRLTASQIEEL